MTNENLRFSTVRPEGYSCLPSPSELQQARAEFAARTGQPLETEPPIDRQQHAAEVIASAALVSRQHDQFVQERLESAPEASAQSGRKLAQFVATIIDL